MPYFDRIAARSISAKVRRQTPEPKTPFFAKSSCIVEPRMRVA